MKLRAVDLFCGAGGTSQGAEKSGAARVVCAVNHWQVAVDTHSANFPHAKHINSRLDQVNPGECPKIDLLFASPECTHHSNARGGRPTSDQQRSGAWDLMRWIEYHRPPRIVVENVPEFASWGPVGDNGRPLKRFKGKFFDAWTMAIQAAGYRVDWRVLNAADYGAATSRSRIFVVARKGNRSPVWPDPTHGDRAGGELPGMELQPWRMAAEIIDWSIPCRSVFLRQKPLKDKTLFRIDAGLHRFVGPYVVQLRNNSTVASVYDPISTVTSGGRHHGVAVPFGMMLTHGGREMSIGNPLPTITTANRGEQGIGVPIILSSHAGGAPRVVNQPTPTQTVRGGDTRRTQSVLESLKTVVAGATRHSIAVPFIKPNFNERDGQSPRAHDPAAPLPTVTSRGAGDLIMPFLVTYYRNGKAQPIADPFPTVTTRDRCGLAYALVESCPSIEPRTEGERRLYATMQQYGVADVGFRMFANPELSAAMGFPSDYVFTGNKGDITKQIGNAVCPDVAEALTIAAAA